MSQPSINGIPLLPNINGIHLDAGFTPLLPSDSFPFSKTITAINTTDIPFLLVGKDNVPRYYEKCPQIPFSANSSLEVWTIYTLRGADQVNKTLELVSKSVAFESASSVSDIFLFYNTLKTHVDNGGSLNFCNVVIKRRISTAVFTNASPRRFYPELDLLIDTRYDPMLSVHPYSEQGKKVLRAVDSSTPPNTLNITIDFIDNENRYGVRYIPIMGKVYPITSRKDLLMPSGVHVDVTMRDGEIGSRIQKFMENPKEFSLIPLAATQEEAEGFANISGKRDEELSSIKHQRELEKIALQEQLAAQELEYAKTKRLQEEETARHKVQTETMLREIKLNFERELANLKRMQQESAIANEAMSNELKLAKAKSEINLDSDSMRVEQMYRRLKLSDELEHSKSQNNLTITQSLAKSAPAIVTGIAGTFIALKLLDSHSLGLNVSNFNSW